MVRTVDSKPPHLARAEQSATMSESAGARPDGMPSRTMDPTFYRSAAAAAAAPPERLAYVVAFDRAGERSRRAERHRCRRVVGVRDPILPVLMVALEQPPEIPIAARSTFARLPAHQRYQGLASP